MRRTYFSTILEQDRLSALENVHVVVLGILNGASVLAEVSAYCVGYWKVLGV